jgi:hypothetical protein
LDTQLREVAFKECLQELLPPGDGVDFTARGERQREASPKPMARLSGRTQVPKAQTLQGYGFDPACESLSRLPKKLGRGAAQNQKTSGQRTSVGQDTQKRKQVGMTLDFIDHHQAFQGAERQVGLRKTRKACRIFEVEIIDGIGCHKFARQRRFAALAWSEQRHNATALQGGSDCLTI